MTARTDPVVMIRRGPNRSSRRPSTIPTIPETTRLAEKAAVTETWLHPVSRTMLEERTAKA